MIDPKYREKWGRGKLQESWSGCSGIVLVTDSTRKGDLMMILMIMVIKMIRMTMIIGQSWQRGRGCGTSSDCDQTACPRWWSRCSGFVRSDCVHTIVLGYKMNGELKGENHNNVFYEVKQQVYFFVLKAPIICFCLLLITSLCKTILKAQIKRRGVHKSRCKKWLRV